MLNSCIQSFITPVFDEPTHYYGLSVGLLAFFAVIILRFFGLFQLDLCLKQLRSYGIMEHTSTKYPACIRTSVQQPNGTNLWQRNEWHVPNPRYVYKQRQASPSQSFRRSPAIDNQTRVLNIVGSQGSSAD